MMRFNKTIVVVFPLVALLLLAGCGGGDNPTPTATPLPPVTPTAVPTQASAPQAATQATVPTAAQTAAATNEAVAASSTQPASPLSAPQSPLPTPVAPATTKDAGALIGTLVVRRPAGNQAVNGVIIGLATVIRDEKGNPKVSGYEAASAPKSITDDAGHFVISDLKPGAYTVILDAVLSQWQLSDPKTGNTIVVQIAPGQVTDLGTMVYDKLPVPGFQ